MQQRQFTSGSRQAPDPFDQFLEEHQYYRKHTARDASCLFRVISEQMYDTQLHHLAIREKCVTYMRKHRKFFDVLVDRDFDEYLDDMSKPKTYGTLLELQAAGYLFQRNVFLFEPFNLGNYFNEYRSYFKEVFRVFYTPERHFDSVFTSEYIEDAAICQSICYEILYKDLFKLPDVSFAVEQMLHGPSFDNMEYRTDSNEDGYATRLYLNDGRAFKLDLPHNTNCILENYKLCHFHYSNFPSFSDDLQRELKGAHNDDNEKNLLLIQRTAESFLPNKYMSCVRQLLQEGITPFPYKVAKALDPNMYRNIEFDSWNEMRKELKLQNWYNGDSNFKLIRYHTKRVRKIFQVGAKCHVKLRKSEQDLYTCHIQEIAVDKGQCIVFIEQLGEKRLVPYENLTPLPADQFKPWTVPYRFQRQMQKFSSVRFTRQYNYRFKFNATTEHHHQFCGKGMDNDSCSNGDYRDYINDDDDDPKRHQSYRYNQKCAAASFYKLKQYTHLENFRTHTVEFCTMPLTVEHNGGGESCESKSGSGQRATSDTNENSRANSRSSNAIAGQNNLEKPDTSEHIDGIQDHLYPPTVGFSMPHGEGFYDMENYNPASAIYVSDLQGFYHMYPYPSPGGIPEDYYTYTGYDGGIAQVPAFMSTASGVNGYYYVCGNGAVPPGGFLSAPGNPYISAPQPIGIPAISQNGTVYANVPHYVPTGGTSNGPALPAAATPTASQNAPSPRPQQRGINQNTPLSGRINYDAKKSCKASGADLPTDKATLRFFYNLGLDYYQQKQSKRHEQNEANKAAEAVKEESQQITTELSNIRLDENANQIADTEKPDANNNSLVPDDNGGTNSDKPGPNSRNTATSTVPNTGGNKTNQRRYNSRYFNSKDRQVQHHQAQRNHHMISNANVHTPFNGPQQHQHQQQQHHHYMRNQGNFSNNYKNNMPSHCNGGGSGGHHQRSTTPNSTRNLQQQQHGGSSSSQQSHYLGHHAGSSNVQQVVQTSPLCGFEDTPLGGIDVRSSNTPNTPHTVTYGGDATNDGLCGGQIAVPFASTAGGVYVPVPISAAPGPPAPFGLFAQPPPGYQTASGQPNFVNGPMHMGVPPPPMPMVASAVNGSGSDCMENNGSGNGSSDIMTNNGLINVSNGMTTAPPLQYTSYPPPHMSYYYAPGGAAVPPPAPHNVATNGGPNGNAGVHLIAQMGPTTPSNHNMPQPFAHPAIGPQGYFCMPPLQQSQQMAPPTPHHQMQQPSPMSANRVSFPGGPIGTPTDCMPNSNNVRPDMSMANE